MFSHLDVEEYQKELNIFLKGTSQFFDGALNELSGKESFEEICEQFKRIENMAFSLSLLPKDLDQKFVHFCLGQDYQNGETFARKKDGSSKVVRFIHRKAQLGDRQFCTHDVLPCNHSWTKDLDYFVACDACRPDLEEEKKYRILKHIKPALPKEPEACLECQRRYERLLDWICLQLAAMIKAVSLSGASIFLTPAGAVARFIFNRLCLKAPKWIRQFQLKTPSHNIPHPNAISFARTVNEFHSRRANYRQLFVMLYNFRNGSTGQKYPGGNSSLNVELGQACEAYNFSTFNVNRMKAVNLARIAIMGFVESQVKAINKLIGMGDSLKPIDYRLQLNRLISQIHLQRLATSSELSKKIAAIPATKSMEPAPVAVPRVARKSSSKLTGKAKRGFFARCYHHLHDCLGQPNDKRRPLMQRLGLETHRILDDPAGDIQKASAKGWKQSVLPGIPECCQDFVCTLAGL